jgi:hypothetical protein
MVPSQAEAEVGYIVDMGTSHVKSNLDKEVEPPIVC